MGFTVYSCLRADTKKRKIEESKRKIPSEQGFMRSSGSHGFAWHDLSRVECALHLQIDILKHSKVRTPIGKRSQESHK